MLADTATVGALFILGFIALGVAILSVLRFWLVEGTLDFGPALGVLGGLLLGSAWVVKTTSPPLMLAWIAVMLGGSLLVPALAARWDKRALHRLYESDIAKFRRSIESGLNSAGAWHQIGELYLKMNRYNEAIAAYKEAIKLQPQDVEKTRRRLNLALEYRAGMPHAKMLACRECGRQTPVGKSCIYCGGALERSFLDWFLQADNLRDISKPTLAIVAAAVAMATLFSALPVAVKAIVILACLFAGVVLIWFVMREEK